MTPEEEMERRLNEHPEFMKGMRVRDKLYPNRLGTVVGPVSSDGFELGCDVDWDDRDQTWDELRMLEPVLVE